MFVKMKRKGFIKEVSEEIGKIFIDKGLAEPIKEEKKEKSELAKKIALAKDKK